MLFADYLYIYRYVNTDENPLNPPNLRQGITPTGRRSAALRKSREKNRGYGLLYLKENTTLTSIGTLLRPSIVRAHLNPHFSNSTPI
jgi:hypothetical protein